MYQVFFVTAKTITIVYFLLHSLKKEYFCSNENNCDQKPVQTFKSCATRKGASETTVPWQRSQGKAPEMKKIQKLPDRTLLLPGSKRDTKN